MIHSKSLVGGGLWALERAKQNIGDGAEKAPFDPARVQRNHDVAAALWSRRAALPPTYQTAIKNAETLVQCAAQGVCQRLLPLKIAFPTVLSVGNQVVQPFVKKAYAETVAQNPKLAPQEKPYQWLWADAGPDDWQKLVPFAVKADLVLCSLWLHGANAPNVALEALFHCLRPGGLMIANFWGGETLMGLRHALAAADFHHFGATYPRVHPFIPLDTASGLLGQTAFRLGVVDQDFFTFKYHAIRDLVLHLKVLGDGRALAAPSAPFAGKAFWDHAAELMKTPPDNTNCAVTKASRAIQDTFHLITLTGWRDGPGIPKPLARGSATQSLQDALGPPAHDRRSKS